MSFVVLLTAVTLFNSLVSDGLSQDIAVIETRSDSADASSSEDTAIQVTVQQGSATPDLDPPADANSQSKSDTQHKTLVLRLRSSTETNAEHGKPPEVQVRGQMILIGPDGKKQEYEFNGPNSVVLMKSFRDGTVDINSERVVVTSDEMLNGKEAESARAGSTDATEGEERFVIGIQCAEADELLRIHLHLGDKGVVVINVRENTPAASGGLQKNDIIVNIDNRDIVSREDLTKAVLESEGKPLTLSIIRAGEPQSITVTPTKMKVPIVVASADTDEEQLKALTGSRKGAFRLQLVHPGIMLERGIPRNEGDFKMMIDQFRTVADQVTKGHEQHRSTMEQTARFRSRVPDQDEDLHQTLRTLQHEMREVQEQLRQMKKQINSNNENQ
jgi:hypothetical protein